MLAAFTQKIGVYKTVWRSRKSLAFTEKFGVHEQVWRSGVWRSGTGLVLRRLKPSFGKVSFPYLNSSQNQWFLARNVRDRKTQNFEFGDLEIKVWKGVIFLIRFLYKNDDLGLETSRNENLWNFDLLPQPFVDRFSKPWLPRKRNRRVEHLIPTWLHARTHAGLVLRRLKSCFGKGPFPFRNSSTNRWYLARNAQHRTKCKSGFPGILKSDFWKVSFPY